MTDKYAVIGNPISHSKSPLIHRMFAKQTGQDISYETIEAPLDGFAATIERLRAEGYKGCNVTVPFKIEAWHLASTIEQRAVDAEASNTLKFEGETIIGDNTDGAGLVRDIEQNLGITLKGKRILLIGAGGAAQGVLHPIIDKKPKLLVISNRTQDKALALKESVKDDVVSVEATGFGELGNAQFDVIINATSAGLSDSAIPLPATIFAPGALAYDMMYGRETPFMAFAREQGAQVADGLGMLVEQAAEAFKIWRGRDLQVDTESVIRALRQAT